MNEIERKWDLNLACFICNYDRRYGRENVAEIITIVVVRGGSCSDNAWERKIFFNLQW